MALEKVTKENVFVGASVFQGEKKLFVYKVNAKSLYVGEEKTDSIMTNWEKRPMGQKWIKFMEVQGGKKVSYEGLTISSEEASKKAGFLKVKEARESMKDWLGVKGRTLLNHLLEIEKKGKNVLMMRNDFGTHQLFIIFIHPDRNGQVLIRLDNAYLFYNVNTKVYTRFDKSIHKDGKNVVFPELILKEEKVAV